MITGALWRFMAGDTLGCLAAALLFLLYIVLTAKASTTAPAIAWNKTYQIAETTAGQLVISTSDGYLIGGYYIIMHTGSGAILIKTDFDGNEVWNRTYEGDLHISSMIAVSDGYVITGNKPYQIGYENMNAFLAKIDRNGNMIWCKDYGGRYGTESNSVIPVRGGYVLAGMFGRSSLSGVYTDAYLVRTDPDGNEVWNRTYGGPGYDDAFTAIIASGDGYVIACMTNGSTWLIKTDPEGNEIWNSTYGTGWGDSMVNASDGYVLVVNPGSVDHARFTDFYLIKTDADGNKVWDRELGKYQSCSLAAVPDGYVLAGGIDISGNFTYQIYLMKIDRNGNLMWNVTYDMASDNYGSAIIVDRGAYVIVGNSRSMGNATPNYLAALLVKTDRDDSRTTPKTPAASMVLATIAVIAAAIAWRSRK